MQVNRFRKIGPPKKVKLGVITVAEYRATLTIHFQ